MRTRIVRIGQARSVLIPEPFIEKAQLGDEVQLRVVTSGILIEGGSPLRAGWADAAVRLHDCGEDRLLDEPLPTDFDWTEWDWE